MRFRVRHITEYIYQNTVVKGLNRAHILPSTTSNQTRLQNIIKVNPTPSSYTQHLDCFGNEFLYFVISEPHQSLTIDITTELDIDPVTTPQSDISIGHSIERFCSLRASDVDVEEFLGHSPLIQISEQLIALAMPFFNDKDRNLLDALNNFTQHVFNSFEYSPGFSSVSTPIEDVLTSKRGVCQDFAHLSIGALRAMGIPTRYVSGYLETLPPPGQEKLIGADASHAWYEVLIPDLGWIGFDPTNNQIAGAQHIITARGRDYSDVPPLQGVFFGNSGHQTMKVSVNVERL